jgi:hypothetical protein
MTNIQAVSFGNQQKHKGPSVGGTIGMATMGAVGGTGVYVAKNLNAMKDCIEIHNEAKKAGGFVGDFTSLVTEKVLKSHKAGLLKFAGLGAAITAGVYVAVKTISGALNKN